MTNCKFKIKIKDDHHCTHVATNKLENLTIPKCTNCIKSNNIINPEMTKNTFIYRIESKPKTTKELWKPFTNTTLIIVQGGNKVILKEKELKKLEIVIGAKFKS